jgi:hypothetical protein
VAYTVREHPGMTLVGLTARTHNAPESRGQGEIPHPRRYLGDFEVYSRQDPTLPVEIFVGIE